MDFLQLGGKFRKHLVVRSPGQVLVAQLVVVVPAPAGADVSHVAVEHGDGRGRLLDENAQQLQLRCQDASLAKPGLLDQDVKQHRGDHDEAEAFELAGFLRPGGFTDQGKQNRIRNHDPQGAKYRVGENHPQRAVALVCGKVVGTHGETALQEHRKRLG